MIRATLSMSIHGGSQHGAAVLPAPTMVTPKPAPMWNVILLDDDEHTYEYVIEMLVKIFRHTPETAFGMACEVDAQKRVIVFTGVLEQAEHKRDLIHGYGADPRLPKSTGSMRATLEQA